MNYVKTLYAVDNLFKIINQMNEHNPIIFIFCKSIGNYSNTFHVVQIDNGNLIHSNVIINFEYCPKYFKTNRDFTNIKIWIIIHTMLPFINENFKKYILSNELFSKYHFLENDILILTYLYNKQYWEGRSNICKSKTLNEVINHLLKNYRFILTMKGCDYLYPYDIDITKNFVTIDFSISNFYEKSRNEFKTFIISNYKSIMNAALAYLQFKDSKNKFYISDNLLKGELIIRSNNSIEIIFSLKDSLIKQLSE